jgi:carbohydrate kinase (thermoresistant glucokinase family)
MIVVLMGVCGCGKSTVGRALAKELGWSFLDADDLHPPANVEKMASGTPLTDDDRWPWYDRIVAESKRLSASGQHVVLACSALKQAYRDRLARGGNLRVVYLKGDATAIEPRLVSRRGHFMPASLLASQFATLEEPAEAIVVDVTRPLAAQVETIARTLRHELPA